MMMGRILDVLFPRRCPVCGEIVVPAGRFVCPSCLGRLSPVKEPVCKRCGKEISDPSEEYCDICRGKKRSFESGVALLNYNEAARKSMSRIKYENKREFLDFYGAALAYRYEKEIKRMRADCIVPVPVHSSRKRSRGFNQAEVLADIVGQKLGIPVEKKLLVRPKKTMPQKNLSAFQRLRNLSGAFAAGTIPKGIRTVLIVDDIYTTGSTIEACSRVLKDAGIERVYFAVLCATGGR